jgi:hypothetical protein
MKSRSVALPIRFYEHVLWSYPKEFRQQFGDQMVAAFTECYRDARDSAGPMGLAMFWISILSDCLVSAFIEHIVVFVKDLTDQSRVLYRSSGFRAAMVALLAIPFCTFGMVITGASGDTQWQRFIFVAGGCVQVGTRSSILLLASFPSPISRACETLFFAGTGSPSPASQRPLSAII